MMVFCAVVYDNPSSDQFIQVDETLLIRIGQEDQDAFYELYSQMSSAIYSYALSILQKPQDAEDIMQDTFLKIRAAAHLYTPQGKPTAWIFTIARNLCMMQFRQNRFTDLYGEEDNDIPDFDKIENIEDRIVLESAFEILSSQDRQIVFLHAVAGMKHREIAEILKIPTPTVLSKYNRSIRKLRDYLGGKL